MAKRKILLIGKLPPPYMGPSVAFEIIINSKLNEIFDLLYLDIKANEQLNTLGKWSFKKLLVNIQKYRELNSILITHRPELVLIPVSQSAIGFIKDSVFVLISSFHSTRIVIQLRGGNFSNWYNSSSFFMKKFVSYILGKTKGVIVQGSILKKLFEGFYHDENIFVVPNGGDFKINPSMKINSNITKITYLGNLQSSKGIEDVIEAAVILNSTHKDKFVIDVVGSWRNESTKAICLSMVNKFNLPVNFLNNKTGDEKFNQLYSSDIFVFTPREPEGHPWVIIEAMAAGLPIIATDRGAITESVINGENGFIIPGKNPEEIAVKMKLLIDDSSLRSKMGAKSREFYLGKFTEECMVRNYSRVFEKLTS